MKLIFVYNANSGRGNAFLDSMHKVLSPGTYNCALCDITYGVFKENTVWKKFRETSDLEFEFLHKDEYLMEYNLKTTFPVIFYKKEIMIEEFISTKKLNKLKDAESLISLITEKTKVAFSADQNNPD